MATSLSVSLSKRLPLFSLLFIRIQICRWHLRWLQARLFQRSKKRLRKKNNNKLRKTAKAKQKTRNVARIFGHFLRVLKPVKRKVAVLRPLGFNSLGTADFLARSEAHAHLLAQFFSWLPMLWLWLSRFSAAAVAAEFRSLTFFHFHFYFSHFGKSIPTKEKKYPLAPGFPLSNAVLPVSIQDDSCATTAAAAAEAEKESASRIFSTTTTTGTLHNISLCLQ